MFDVKDIGEKISDGVKSQLKGSNGGTLVLAGILVAGLVGGLKVIAQHTAPQLKSDNNDIYLEPVNDGGDIYNTDTDTDKTDNLSSKRRRS